MRHDLLSDALSALTNGDMGGKKDVVVPASNLLKEVFILLQKEGFIGEFEHMENNRGGMIKVELRGQINKCGSIRPRSSVRSDEYQKWEKRFLPAAGVGLLIISTSKGIMTQTEAQKNKIGGRLLAYIY